MFENYVKVALRTLRRESGYALINITGLAVGIAACLLIALYVWDEVSYDQFSPHAERTYRLVDGAEARTPGAVSPALREAHPALVDATARFWPLFAPAKLRRDDVVFVEDNVAFADARAPYVMGYTMTTGDPSSALAASNTIVLSESMAHKYFGGTAALGQTMRFWGRDLTVAGVVADVPRAAHYRPDALVSMSTLQQQMGHDLADFPMYSYVLLHEAAQRTQLEQALDQLRLPGGASHEVQTQPITAIHFASQIEGNPRPGGNWGYVVMLMSVALFVLGLAIVNFINLATARATVRAKEVGLRKTLGARQPQLVGQFIGESLLLALGAVGVAFMLVELALPLFETVAGKPRRLWGGNRLLWGSIALGMGAVVGLLAGSYPAFVLSRFQPARVLKGRYGRSVSGTLLRKGLVVGQFAVAIALVASVGVIYEQAQYLQGRDLGYGEEGILVLDADRYPVLKDALLDVPGVTHVTGAPRLMGQPLAAGAVRAPGQDSAHQMRRMPVSVDFIEAMDMRIVAGRSFSSGRSTDATESILLNEAAVQALGWSDPVGRTLTLSESREDDDAQEVEGSVIGVVENFNYLSLHNPVGPVVLYLSSDPNLVLARLAERSDATLAQVEQAWTRVNPDAPFNAYFLDDHLQQAYQAERRLMQLFGGFAGLAVIVACLGLFGLAAHTVQQRTKEIGIRKALGASVAGLVALLSGDVLRLVAVAFILAAPVAYIAMSTWLDGFAYRVDLGVGVFLGAGVLALGVALITVSMQSIRAALADPVQALRAE